MRFDEAREELRTQMRRAFAQREVKIYGVRVRENDIDRFVDGLKFIPLPEGDEFNQARALFPFCGIYSPRKAVRKVKDEYGWFGFGGKRVRSHQFFVAVMESKLPDEGHQAAHIGGRRAGCCVHVRSASREENIGEREFKIPTLKPGDVRMLVYLRLEGARPVDLLGTLKTTHGIEITERHLRRLLNGDPLVWRADKWGEYQAILDGTDRIKWRRELREALDSNREIRSLMREVDHMEAIAANQNFDRTREQFKGMTKKTTSGNKQLTREQVIEMRNQFRTGAVSMQFLAKTYGIWRDHVALALRGQRYGEIPGALAPEEFARILHANRVARDAARVAKNKAERE
jgi:hypothetical protein